MDLLSYFKTASKIVGLDIGSSSVKLVQIEKAGSNFNLGFVGLCPVPLGTIVEKSIRNPEAISEAINSLFENARVGCKLVSTSIAGKAVIIKQVTVTAMTDLELEKLIQIEAEPYIPFGIEDVHLDFFILGETPGKPGFMEVILVAVKKDFMAEYVDVIASANLTTAVVDVDPFALEVMYEYCYPDVSEEVVALIDIGAATINVNILRAGVSQFTRDLPLGGDFITREIMRFFNVDFFRAENIKRGSQLGHISPGGLESIFRRYVDLYVSELRKIMDFFAENVSKQNVGRMLLSGGVSATYGLRVTIEREFGVPVEIVDPFRVFGVNPKVFDVEYLNHVGASMAVAVGLALRDERDKLR